MQHMEHQVLLDVLSVVLFDLLFYLFYSISFTVFIDLALVIICLLVAFTTAVAISIGLKVTCDAVKARYGDDGDGT